MLERRFSHVNENVYMVKRLSCAPRETYPSLGPMSRDYESTSHRTFVRAPTLGRRTISGCCEVDIFVLFHLVLRVSSTMNRYLPARHTSTPTSLPRFPDESIPSALLYADTDLFKRGNTGGLPRKASWKILQPESAGNISCCRETHGSSHRPGCAERHVMHDSSRRRIDGVQHVWSGCRGANEGDLVIFNGLRWNQDSVPV